MESPSDNPTRYNLSHEPTSIIEASLADSIGRALAIDVGTRQEQENWLLLTGAVNEVNGGEFDFTDTIYQSAIEMGVFENQYIALLEKGSTLASYKLIELSFGSTDTPVEQWIRKYSVPPELFGDYTGVESLQW